MVGVVGEMASMKRRKLWKTGEDGLCCSSSAIQTRLGPSSLLEGRSEIPIVFVVLLWCRLPPKTEGNGQGIQIDIDQILVRNGSTGRGSEKLPLRLQPCKARGVWKWLCTCCALYLSSVCYFCTSCYRYFVLLCDLALSIHSNYNECVFRSLHRLIATW